MRSLDLYLSLERLMIELDEDGNPLADEIRDLMDPVWRRLSEGEVALLDARGTIEPTNLFPAQLPVPEAPVLPKPTVDGQRFETVGLHVPDAWRNAA